MRVYLNSGAHDSSKTEDRRKKIKSFPYNGSIFSELLNFETIKSKFKFIFCFRYTKILVLEQTFYDIRLELS